MVLLTRASEPGCWPYRRHASTWPTARRWVRPYPLCQASNHFRARGCVARETTIDHFGPFAGRLVTYGLAWAITGDPTVMIGGSQVIPRLQFQEGSRDDEKR